MMAVVLLLALCPAAYISCFESFFVQFDFCLFSVVDGFLRHCIKHAVLGIVLIGFYVTKISYNIFSGLQVILTGRHKDGIIGNFLLKYKAD